MCVAVGGCSSAHRCVRKWDASARKIQLITEHCAVHFSAARTLQSLIWPQGCSVPKSLCRPGKSTSSHCLEAAEKIIDCDFCNIYSSSGAFLKV